MIQATSDLVDLEQVIKGAEEVGRKNRGDNLESAIKEGMGKKGGGFERVGQDERFGQEDLSETVEQEYLEIDGEEDLETVGKEYYAPPTHPPHPEEVNKK